MCGIYSVKTQNICKECKEWLTRSCSCSVMMGVSEVFKLHESLLNTKKLKLAAKNLNESDSFQSRFVRHLLKHNKKAFSGISPKHLMQMFLAGVEDPNIFREFAEFCVQNQPKDRHWVCESDFKEALEMFEICEINQSEECQIAAVKKNGLIIRYIENPSEEVQLEAVKNNGFAIEHIEKPSEEVQVAAMETNGHAIQGIENPSEAAQIAAVGYNGHAIIYIKNPSEAVQLAAIKQSEYAIKHIENPSIKVQLAAVSQSPGAIGFIQNPSKEVLDFIEVNKIHSE